MYEIDKKKFGAWIGTLRREKGYTQRELAERLFISDKAVSKWETGVSIPDTALLIPLAELLGVTVTELLLCHPAPPASPMEPEQVESIVKTALAYPEEQGGRVWQTKSLWPVFYLCALLAGLAAALGAAALRLPLDTLLTALILGAVFGAYFCFFAKTRLPAFYDQHRCGQYADGVFRMNVPGVAFNNANWPHILRAGRTWSCLFLALYPGLTLCASRFFPELWRHIELPALLLFLLGGLFLPMYAAGRKYG